MDVRPVDERDARVEMDASGYRVMILRPGRRVSAFDVDGATLDEARAWAVANAEGGAYALAARFDESGGGVTLMWLTPPPGAVLDSLGP